MKTVALYFGTFNPLHIGHVSIVRYLNDCPEIDEVRLIVSPQSPFKHDAVNSDIERLDRVKADVARMDLYVTVSDVEFQLPRPSYTIKTLRYIKKEEPSNHFILVIGADNLIDFHKWYCFEEIVRDYPIWVYPRIGVPDTLSLCEKYNAVLLDAPMIDISSTEIRIGEKTAGI